MDVGDLVIAFIALVSAVAALCVWREAKKFNRCQLLEQLMRDYAKPEMQQNVSALWSFEKQCRKENKNISDEFGRLLDSGDQTINTARRPVTHFYQRMAVLHHDKVVKDELLYRLWSKSDLSIIPKILKPLENALLQRHGEMPTNQLSLLDKLYEDSDLYWYDSEHNIIDS